MQVIGERIEENVKKIEFFRGGINDIRKSATKGAMRIVMGYALAQAGQLGFVVSGIVTSGRVQSGFSKCGPSSRTGAKKRQAALR